MESKRVLLIDDDTELVEPLKIYLGRNGWELLWSASGYEGLELLGRERVSVVILDVMLPGKDGFGVCRDIRESYDLPVLMLSARGEVDDKVVGLTVGADDYLSKPFDPRELSARLDVLYARGYRGTKSEGGVSLEGVWSYGGLEVDENRGEAKFRGDDIVLTAMEFDLLVLLMSHGGKRFSRYELLNRLQGIDADIYTRSVDVLVSRLRKKLREKDERLGKWIVSERNKGYVFLPRGWES
jgi:OmpR family response regulator RpaB